MNRRKILAGAGVVLAGLAATKKPAVAATPKATPNIFDFGAVGDGSTDDSAAFNSALSYSALNMRMVLVPGVTYAIAHPIVWTSTANVSGRPWGFTSQGATLVSKLTGGQDVMHLDSRHLVRYFKIVGGMGIVCNGSDGNGLHLSCYGSSIYFYNNQIDGLSIDGAGQNGLFVEGNVFETIFSNCYFQVNKKNGAMFAQSKGGVVSAINVFSCFMSNNGQYGLCCTNLDSQYGGTTDVRVYGGYCRENGSYGMYYNNGTGGSSCVEQVGFENNCTSLKPGDPNGAHVYALDSMMMRNCGGYNMFGGATYMLRGYFNDLVLMDGCIQDSGGAMAATGKSRLVQVSGAGTGMVLIRGCRGGVDAVSGTPCKWQAQNSVGTSPRGTLSLTVTL